MQIYNLFVCLRFFFYLIVYSVLPSLYDVVKAVLNNSFRPLPNNEKGKHEGYFLFHRGVICISRVNPSLLYTFDHLFLKFKDLNAYLRG